MSTKGKRNIYTQKDCKSSAYKSRTDPPQYTVFAKLDGSELDEVIEREGIVYDRTDHIPIDLDAMPEYMKERLFKASWELTKRIMSQPELRRKMEEKTAARLARKRQGRSNANRDIT